MKRTRYSKLLYKVGTPTTVVLLEVPRVILKTLRDALAFYLLFLILMIGCIWAFNPTGVGLTTAEFHFSFALLPISIYVAVRYGDPIKQDLREFLEEVDQ